MKADKKRQAFANDAFIRCSRRDIEFASEMEEALEDYKPPRDLNLVEEHDLKRR